MLFMNLSAIGPEQPEERGPITVGWLKEIDRGGLLYAGPERVQTRPPNKAHAKSASRCPAVLQMESRYFSIPSPVDLHIGFARDANGKPHLVNRAGAASPVRANKLGEMLVLVNEAEWRDPQRPTIQMKLPYVFIADEPVYITQLDAFMHYRHHPLPGTIFGGRFPIHVWPRPLMWAMEWHDTSKDLVLKRGDPLFYLQFEGYDPSRPVSVVEAERTPELDAYMREISGVVNYVNQTFSLFKEAEAIRPSKLVSPKPRAR